MNPTTKVVAEYKLGLIQSRGPITERQQDLLRKEAEFILKGAATLTIWVPSYSDRDPEAGVEPFLHTMAKNHSRITLKIGAFGLRDQPAVIHDWLSDCDSWIACPHRARAGAIVDRVWFVTRRLRAQGRNVLVIYPRDK